MPRATCAEQIALSVLCCVVCWRCHVLIGSSTGVIGEEKIAKRTEMEDEINDESKKMSTHTRTTDTWYLVLRQIPAAWWYSVFLKKAQGSAPRELDAARYARARKNATETCKGGRKKRPGIFWCGQRSDNANRCLCRANCPALCCVLVDVTF